MAYSESDAQRMRAALKGARGITERKMFGGICFLLHGNMLCGIGKPGFMFRVGKEQHAAALKRPGASAVAFNGRRFAGLVWVRPDECTGSAMRSWLALAHKFVAPLPAKRKSKR
jgi:TfoX/Sxy family transcriptional regulator of competence genes